MGLMNVFKKYRSVHKFIAVAVLTVNNGAIGYCRYMISFVREKLLQNMIRVGECVCEEVVVHVGSQLRRPAGIVAGIEAEPNNTPYR